MLAFVTVGSTRFDELVATALSSAFQDALSRKGYTNIIIQRGNSPDPPQRTDGMGSVQVEIWQFKPTLQSYYERADLVISHAGSGTILEVLRLGKPLIAVPNPTLMHNHQEELASALESLGHLKAATVNTLDQVVESFDVSTIVPFPPQDGSKFRVMLDEEMGF